MFHIGAYRNFIRVKKRGIHCQDIGINALIQQVCIPNIAITIGGERWEGREEDQAEKYADPPNQTDWQMVMV